MECRLDQREGSVPAANIAPVSLTGLLQDEVICVARSGHIAQNLQQLNLRKGKATVSTANCNVTKTRISVWDIVL